MTALDDSSSIQILKTIAQARLSDEQPDLAPTPDLRASLAAVFGDPPQAAASEGDLARAALDLLAQDPAFAEPIQIMTRNAAGVPAASQRYLDPATIAVTTAALLALQTRVKFKRDHTGKWAIEIEKKSASDGTIKLLAQRLLSLLPP
jgi:hypothetical protein